MDERGLWVYGNKAGLVSLAERLLRIAQADPDNCFECHTRWEMGDNLDLVRSAEVSLIVDEKIREYFFGMPDNGEADATPIGFELTFMHIYEEKLGELRKQALKPPSLPVAVKQVVSSDGNRRLTVCRRYDGQYFYREDRRATFLDALEDWQHGYPVSGLFASAAEAEAEAHEAITWLRCC